MKAKNANKRKKHIRGNPDAEKIRMVDPTNKSRTRTLWNASLANLPEPDAETMEAIRLAGQDSSITLPAIVHQKPKKGPTKGQDSILLNNKIKNKLLVSLAKGTPLSSALGEVGVAKGTYYKFIKVAENSDNPEVLKLVNQLRVAYQMGTRFYELLAQKQALFDAGMTRFMLVSREPEVYGQANGGRALPPAEEDPSKPATNIHNTLLVMLQNSVQPGMDADQIAEIVRRKFKQIETFKNERIMTLDEVNALNANRKKK